jgi:hypothetical protein
MRAEPSFGIIRVSSTMEVGPSIKLEKEKKMVGGMSIFLESMSIREGLRTTGEMDTELSSCWARKMM